MIYIKQTGLGMLNFKNQKIKQPVTRTAPSQFPLFWTSAKVTRFHTLYIFKTLVLAVLVAIYI